MDDQTLERLGTPLDPNENTPLLEPFSSQAQVYEALRKSEERYRELVEHANSIIMRWDHKSRITFFNEFAQKFFGFSESEIIGQHVVGTIVPETESTGRDLRPLMVDICNNPEKYQYNVNENITKSGNRVWVAWTNKVLTDNEGNLIGALSIGTDITEQKRLEEELRQSYKMQAIGELAGGIAHDFNNMIHGIMGYAQIIAGTNRDLKQQEYAENILSTAKHASDLTKQLLTFARKGNYKLESCNIHVIIQDVIRILEHTIDRRVYMRKQFSAKNNIVFGDVAQLKSALLNLALNAKDAMSDGGAITFSTEDIHFGTSVLDLDDFNLSAGNYIKVTVQDTGHGMDETTRQRVFEPFFTTKNLNRGTGLGLAAVYGTAHLHKGAIRCKSRIGFGTSFELFLPRSDQTIDSEESKTLPSYSIQPVSIMLIDDEPIVRTYTKTLFEYKGHQVKCFADAYEAIEYYRLNFLSLDLVLLDMIMPKINGIQTFAHLKKINPDIKAILATGYCTESKLKEIHEAGIYDCIQKPFTIEDLERKLQNI